MSHASAALTTHDVQKIAHLARLAITDDETAAFQTQLNDFFALVQPMQTIDTTGIVPMSHPLDAWHEQAATLTALLSQPLRADAVTEPNQRDACQAVAPATQNGLYLVPKVID
jgi:aspartyl-tRNA(Asn)/glutamyl-tRNA(Gln) amidotransferase subunit C